MIFPETAMDRKLSQEELSFLEEAFRLFDKDGDGRITAEDLGSVISQSLNRSHSKEELREMINEADRDGNGTIERDEFFDALAEEMKESESEEDLRELFLLFDEDNNGFISPYELMNALKKLGRNITLEEVMQIINEADLDGDEQINFDEFVKTMRRME